MIQSGIDREKFDEECFFFPGSFIDSSKRMPPPVIPFLPKTACQHKFIFGSILNFKSHRPRLTSNFGIFTFLLFHISANDAIIAILSTANKPKNDFLKSPKNEFLETRYALHVNNPISDYFDARELDGDSASHVSAPLRSAHFEFVRFWLLLKTVAARDFISRKCWRICTDGIMQKVKNAFSHSMRFPQILKNHSVAKIKKCLLEL
ncbi:MAG: hypothetical protein LIP10_01105 [Clostridiales bacterium]|nr:hypothetical protein [Clostridiales bacterium]